MKLMSTWTDKSTIGISSCHIFSLSISHLFHFSFYFIFIYIFFFSFFDFELLISSLILFYSFFFVFFNVQFTVCCFLIHTSVVTVICHSTEAHRNASRQDYFTWNQTERVFQTRINKRILCWTISEAINRLKELQKKKTENEIFEKENKEKSKRKTKEE